MMKRLIFGLFALAVIGLASAPEAKAQAWVGVGFGGPGPYYTTPYGDWYGHRRYYAWGGPPFYFPFPFVGGPDYYHSGYYYPRHYHYGYGGRYYHPGYRYRRVYRGYRYGRPWGYRRGVWRGRRGWRRHGFGHRRVWRGRHVRSRGFRRRR